MSLQVWLPLNGNVNNQGLSNISFSNVSSNTVINSLGKIGECYGNNSFSSGGLISTSQIDLGSNQSMFCWVKFTSLNRAASLGAGLVSQHRHATKSGMGLTIKYVSSTTGYLSVNTGNGSTRTYNSYCATTLMTAGTWYHVGYTYDGNNIRLYVDGVLEKTQAYSGMYVPSDYLTVFCWSMDTATGTEIHPEYKLNGYLNDVRIYDHCLSAKEVKEISKGLMCHYRLSGCGGENLIKDNFSCTSTKDTYSATGSVTCTLTADDIMANLGKTLTLSYKVKSAGTFTSSVSESSFQYNRFGIHGRMVYVNTSGSTVTTYPLADLLIRGKKEGLYYTTWTIPTDIASVNKRLSFSVQTNPAGGYAKPASDNDDTWYIKDVKLEWGSKPTPWCPNPADELYSTLGYNDATEYDCSGYGNNGTKVGDIVWKGDSARYSGSYGISGVNRINASNIAFENMEQGTLSFWIKFNNSFNNWSHYVFFANAFNQTGNGADFIIIANRGQLSSTANASSTAIYIDCCSYGYGMTVTTDTWYHIAITWDAKNYVIKKYFNGDLIQTIDDSTNKRLDTYRSSHNYHFIGNGLANTGHSGDFNISDLRIYSTVLDESDIKSLYNVAASADKSGVFSAYEFVEG